MPEITTGRVAVGGGIVGAALLAALLLPGREPPAGLAEARLLAGVERAEGEGEGCAATWGSKRHDGCYLAGALRLVAEQRDETPEWKTAQWIAEAEAYEAGCGPLPDPDATECAVSPFCRGSSCATRINP